MRQLTAAQLDGGWQYVSAGPRGVHPQGACQDHPPHPTEEEARSCYAAWQRDRLVRSGMTHWQTCTAPGCVQPACRVWVVQDGWGYTVAVLCESHDDHDEAVMALELDRPAGDAWLM